MAVFLADDELFWGWIFPYFFFFMIYFVHLIHSCGVPISWKVIMTSF